MIQSFKDKATAEVFEKGVCRKFGGLERIIVRKLTQIDIANRLSDLRYPPGNRLEALMGDRIGQHSIRINDQFRICFYWRDDGVYDVEIVDYH